MLDTLTYHLARFQFRLFAGARSRLWKRISWLSNAGVPITKALEYLHDSKTTSKAGLRFIRHQRIAMRGVGFAEGAADWIPKEELLLIHVTQEGRIAEGFQQASRFSEVRSKVRSTVYAGLFYPLLLLLAGGAAIAILPGQALGVMHQLMDIERWPPISRSVLYFSEFIGTWGLPLLISAAAVLGASIWAAPRWTGRLRNAFDWYPIFVLYRRFSAPEVLSAWLALMQAGVQRVKALAQLEAGLPPYLASHLQQMRSRLYRGADIENAFDTGLFSQETLDDLRIYERVGNFSQNVDQLAEQDIERTLERLSGALKMLGSVILILIGLAAVWMYAGIARVAMSLQQLAF